MHARVTTIMGSAERAKETRTRLAEEFAPKAKEIPGLSRAYFLQDASSGKVVVVTLFESEAALMGSQESAKRVREAAVGALGATVESIDEFEVIAQI